MDFDPDSMTCVGACREFMRLRDCQQVWSLTLLPDPVPRVESTENELSQCLASKLDCLICVLYYLTSTT